MSENPLDQFKIIDLVPLKAGSYNLSFTNSALFMLIGFCVITLFFAFAISRSTNIPGKLQSSAELMHNFLLGTLNETTSGKGERYLPFIFSLFSFVLVLNLLGLMPSGFTVTSHISITFALALCVFISVTAIAFIKHGFKFFSFFLPQGIPVFLAPLMVLIELFTYLTRPVSLSIRLAANMMVGHLLMFVIAGFILMMGIWGWLPGLFIVLFTGFELFVAIIQAYIFTVLTCTYLNDAINLH